LYYRVKVKYVTRACTEATASRADAGIFNLI
jgi:hypothetical protein